MKKSLPSLAFENAPMVGASAFEGDALEREALALKLTGYIDRLKAGAVLAIDAPWGEGKSWFGKNWAKKLEEEHRVAYIDAFEQDYIEDPFLLLASELINMTEEGSDTKIELSQKAVGVAKATLSIGARVGMGLVTKYALGGVDLGDEVEKAIGDASAETAQLSSRLIEKSFEKYEQNKQTIAAFRDELAKYAASQEKPIVIFVDELDRCKPNFAVGLIERIKHFFDVPNVIFVLLLNRDQLEKAVKGVYGSETDASTYLGKFVNFFFALPRPAQDNFHIAKVRINKFIEVTMRKYQFKREEQNRGFIEYLKTWAQYFDLSLRDIEKCIALYAFAYPMGKLSWLITYLIVLKIKHPVLFRRLVSGKIEAHQEAKELMEGLIKDAEIKNDNNNVERIFPFYYEWHDAHVNKFTELGGHFGTEIPGTGHIERHELFSTLAKYIELDIER